MHNNNINEEILFENGVHYKLFKAWDDLYRIEELTKQHIQEFIIAVQTAYDLKQITKQDVLHFTSLVSHLEPQE